MSNKDIEQIKIELELEGVKSGTEEFNYKFLERKVTLCQNKHGVSTCQTCSYFEECDLSRNFLLAKIYKIRPPTV